MHKFTFKKTAKDQSMVKLATYTPMSIGEIDAGSNAKKTFESDVDRRLQRAEYEEALGRPFAVFMGSIGENGTAHKPVSGKFHVVVSDYDGDGKEDLDESGKPVARSWHHDLITRSASSTPDVSPHHPNCDETGCDPECRSKPLPGFATKKPGTGQKYDFIQIKIPTSSFPNEPRIRRMIGKKSNSQWIFGYVPREIWDQVDSNSRLVSRSVNQRKLVKSLLAASAKGSDITTEASSSEKPIPLAAVHKDGWMRAKEYFFKDKHPLARAITPEQGEGLCVCDSPEEDHITEKQASKLDDPTGKRLHPFLPQYVRQGVTGRLVDAVKLRSRKSPTRQGYLPTEKASGDIGFGSNLASSQLRAAGDDEATAHDSMFMVRVSTSPEFLRHIHNVEKTNPRTNMPLSRYKNRLPKKSRPIPCRDCMQSGRDLPFNRENTSWCQDCADPDNKVFKEVIDANTGEPRLAEDTDAGSGRCKNHREDPQSKEWTRSTFFNVLPFNKCKSCGGWGYKWSKKRENEERPLRTEWPITQYVNDRIGNLIVAAKRKPTDLFGWSAQANPSCHECHGDNDYQHKDAPCKTCSIADLSASTLDNPVSPTGVKYVFKDHWEIPLVHMHQIVRDVYNQLQQQAFPGRDDIDLNPHSITSDSDLTQRSTTKKIRLGDKIHELVKKKYPGYLLKSGERVPARTEWHGVGGDFIQAINKLGEPALTDEDLNEVVGRITPGFSDSPSNLKKLNRAAALIRKSPNAKYRGASQELQLVIDHARSSLLDMAENSLVRTPTVSPGAVEMPENAKALSKEQLNYVNIEEPGFVGLHRSVVPHVADINKAKFQMLDPNDNELDTKLQGLYSVASDAIKQRESTKSVSPEVRTDVAQRHQDVLDHIASNYSSDAAGVVANSLNKLVWPAISPSQSQESTN